MNCTGSHVRAVIGDAFFAAVVRRVPVISVNRTVGTNIVFRQPAFIPAVVVYLTVVMLWLVLLVMLLFTLMQFFVMWFLVQ